ncbi:hypothetical protein K2X33_03875 [bacterium]|nr:hypothetical protein [bacterium]
MRTRFIILFASGLAFTAKASPPTTEYTSRVYFVIHETTPFQIQRGRKIVEREFQNTFQNVPTFRGQRYQVTTDGNEVIFSLVTPDDVRTVFQGAVSETVGHLNGQVRTKGRYDLLRTDFEPTPRSSLLVVLDDSNTRIQSIVARSVPVRDLLAELQLQFSEEPPVPSPVTRALRVAARRKPKSDFSYFLPSNCASQEIDWNFGAEAPQPAEKPAPETVLTTADFGAPTVQRVQQVALKAAQISPAQRPAAKSIEEAMQEIARAFQLSVLNVNGNYRFIGDCQPAPRRAPALEFLPTRWLAPTPPPHIEHQPIPVVFH